MCSQRRSANSYGLHALLSIANRCTRHDTGSTIVPEKRNTRDTKVGGGRDEKQGRGGGGQVGRGGIRQEGETHMWVSAFDCM